MTWLIHCPACKNPVSTNAEKCQICGEPDPSRRERNRRWLKKAFGLVILISSVSYAWFVAVPNLQQKWSQLQSQNR